jgi:hypothetical protein
MTKLNPKVSFPADLLRGNEPAAAEKIADFIGAGAEKLHMVLDFDRTLTVGRAGKKGDVTTWNIMMEHLPAAGKKTYRQLFDYYRELEIQGEMNKDHAVEWWSRVLDLYVRYKIDMSAVERDFLAHANVRAGTTELFALCERYQIPTVVLSAGIKQVIDIWSRTYGVHPGVVLSTSLILDSANTVSGWDRLSLVLVLYKYELDHPVLA